MNKLPLIEKATSMSGFKKNGRDNHVIGVVIFLVAISSLFAIAAFRLFQLTIVKGEYYRRLSDENRIREIIIEPKRGTITDRNGTPLAQSTTVDPMATGSARLVSKRMYAEPQAVAHIVGYRQTADKQDFDNDMCLEKLDLGDKTGKKGVEQAFECDLRGTKGKKLIELDAHGSQIKTLGIVEPVAGKNITLALDLPVQKKAFELFNKQDEFKKGAVVALIPQTGEVLTLFSNPTFNSQDFEDSKQSNISLYLTSKDYPLFNRATEGSYPPGSIFKLFVATGALEDNKIKEDTQIEDTGQITAGPLTFGNWYYLQYGKKEGELTIVSALKRSNDIFFYKTGEKLGIDRINHWAGEFGFGKKTTLPFDQTDGVIPSPFWKEETLKEQWYLGDTYNISIGQGYLLTSPLQIAQATAVFANGGKLCQPQLLKDAKPDCKTMNISQKTIQLVREGMKEACSTGGTGWPFFEFKIKDKPMQVGCKTGTAEAHGSKETNPHAWFTVFAPFDNPKIVISVLVENGGQGSDIAGPVAKELVKAFFER